PPPLTRLSARYAGEAARSMGSSPHLCSYGGLKPSRSSLGLGTGGRGWSASVPCAVVRHHVVPVRLPPDQPTVRVRRARGGGDLGERPRRPGRAPPNLVAGQTAAAGVRRCRPAQ